MRHEFYYPIDLHYSQTEAGCCFNNRNVLLPYRFTLLSNQKYNRLPLDGFYYPIDLHYSQTER